METRQRQALADQRHYQAQKIALRDDPEIRRAESDSSSRMALEDRAEARRRQRRLTKVRGERRRQTRPFASPRTSSAAPAGGRRT